MTLALSSAAALRVVPDASVIVSALLSPEGPSGRVLRRFLEDGAFELILTEEIVSELRRALGDRRVKRHLRLDANQISRLTMAVTLLGTFVEVAPRSPAGMPEAAASDPVDGDEKYLAAARAAAPSLVVTLDPRLIATRHPRDVEVVSPRVLLELLDVAPVAGNSPPLRAFT